MAVQINSQPAVCHSDLLSKLYACTFIANPLYFSSSDIIDRQYANIDSANFKNQLRGAHLQLFHTNCLMSKYRNVFFNNEPPQVFQIINNYHKRTQKSSKPAQPEHFSIRLQSETSDANLPRQPSRESNKLSIRKVFLVMSRVHHSFKLRFQTLFLALEIYLKYQGVTSQNSQNPEEQKIPEGCLILVCLYLAMKFQEIYPPRLKCLFPFVKVDITTKQYTAYQTIVLLKLSANLALRTAKDSMDQLLKDSPNQVYFQAYYFLQIAYSTSTITHQYPIHTICKSICYIMSPISDIRKSSNFKGTDTNDMIGCSKLLIQARNTHNQNDSTINRKYSHERYMKAAERPWISLRCQE